MDIAVVKIDGKQHLVSPGQKIIVNSQLGEVDKEVVLKDVLATVVGDQIKVGTPLVDRAKVTAKIVSIGRGDKVRVAKFKAKSRYRRVMGFRPNETTLAVTGIK